MALPGKKSPDTHFHLQNGINDQREDRRSGCPITIFDERTRWDNSKPTLERVVVTGVIRSLRA